jgi:putative transposase
VPELERHLSETYGVVYAGGSSYYQLLHEAGLSWKKQQKTHPQRDEAAVEVKKRDPREAGGLGNRDSARESVSIYGR